MRRLLLRWAARIVSRELGRLPFARYEMGWLDGNPMMVKPESIAQVVRRWVGGEMVNNEDIRTEFLRDSAPTTGGRGRG